MGGQGFFATAGQASGLASDDSGAATRREVEVEIWVRQRSMEGSAQYEKRIVCKAIPVQDSKLCLATLSTALARRGGSTVQLNGEGIGVAKDAQPRSANYDGLTGKGAVGPPCICRMWLWPSPQSMQVYRCHPFIVSHVAFLGLTCSKSIG